MSDPKSRQVFEDGANELEKFEERSDEKVAERLYFLFKLINSCEAIEYNDVRFSRPRDEPRKPAGFQSVRNELEGQGFRRIRRVVFSFKAM